MSASDIPEGYSTRAHYLSAADLFTASVCFYALGLGLWVAAFWEVQSAIHITETTAQADIAMNMDIDGARFGHGTLLLVPSAVCLAIANLCWRGWL